MKICSKCLSKNDEKANFCSKCGSELEEISTNTNPKNKKSSIKIFLITLISTLIAIGLIGFIVGLITAEKPINDTQNETKYSVQSKTNSKENDYIHCKFIQIDLYKDGKVSKEEYIPRIILYNDKTFKFISNEYSGIATYYGEWYREYNDYVFSIDYYDYNGIKKPISELTDSVILDTQFTVTSKFSEKTAELVSNSCIGMTGAEDKNFYIDNSNTEIIDYNYILTNSSIKDDASVSSDTKNNKQKKYDTRVRIGMHRSEIENLWGKPWMEKPKGEETLCFYYDKYGANRVVGYYSNNVCGSISPDYFQLKEMNVID